MKNLLIVAHISSKNTKHLAKIAKASAQINEIENVNVLLKTPLETSVEDVLQADGIVIGTTENFGYMAGLTKDYFERIYYPVLEKKQGLPVVCYIRAGLDGTGATLSIESIVTGLRWRWVQPPLVLKGEWQDDFIEQVGELVGSFAMGLDMSIY